MGAFDDIEGELSVARAQAEERARSSDELTQSQFALLTRLASEFASFALQRGFQTTALLGRGGPRECWRVTLVAADPELNLRFPIGVLRSGEWITLERGVKTNIFGTRTSVGWQPRPERRIEWITQYDIEKSFRDEVALRIGGA